MILFGGMNTLLGPVVGAAAIIIIEDLLSSFRLGLPWGIDAIVSAHWMALLGALIIVVVLALKKGLYGSLVEREAGAD
jgi:branched-chain amino acid transport system permease protein